MLYLKSKGQLLGMLLTVQFHLARNWKMDDLKAPPIMCKNSYPVVYMTHRSLKNHFFYITSY